jgi:hypothetical protein
MAMQREMQLVISPKVAAKLAAKKPPVSQEEILQCFANRSTLLLVDNRENHQSDPQTLWFIAQTDFGRQLKVVFIPRNGEIVIRTAYDPSPEALAFYESRH